MNGQPSIDDLKQTARHLSIKAQVQKGHYETTLAELARVKRQIAAAEQAAKPKVRT